MEYCKVPIQKISESSTSYFPAIRAVESKEVFFPYWSPADENAIRINEIKDSIYLYLFYNNNSGKDNINKIAICKLKKKEDKYELLCEELLEEKCKIDYVLGVNDISPSRDFPPYEYVTLVDDVGLYNRVNDFIYYCYYHKIKEPGEDRLYNDDNYIDDTSKIIGCKAFRRLENKAQIYSSMKGDHYRNRLTHTLDVANIALLIARKLKIFDDALCAKVETISFGHDVGHTPFGHIGERTSDDIISGKVNIINNAGEMLHNDVGGFKHNIQSVRILTKLENTTKKYKGLNVSYEVLEGILKHSNYEIEDAEKIIPIEYKDKLNFNLHENTYLSGKIVNIADEIAQRCADIEDAVRSKQIGVDDILRILNKEDFLSIKEKYCKSIDNGIPVIDETGIKISILQNIIKEYFVTQLVQNFNVNEKLEFNEKTDRLNKMIKKLIDDRVLHTTEVCNFDNKGKIIIENLFRLYYNNPMLLNDNTIRNIFLDMMDNDVCWKKSPIDFGNMSQEFINKEICAIHSLEVVDGKMTSHEKALIEECGGIECVYESQKIIIRNICDYIAGMTDEFAQSEYMEKVLALSID